MKFINALVLKLMHAKDLKIISNIYTAEAITLE